MSFPSEISLFFLFIFCLNDETKHSALGGAEHFSCSFVPAHLQAPHVIGLVS